MSWTLYLLECVDGSLYAGITNDLERRFEMHLAGKGAKYTRRRGPVALAFARRCRDKRLALRIEYQIKQLTRAQKDALVAEPKRIDPIARRAQRDLRAALA